MELNSLYDSSMAGNPADPTTAAAQLKWLEERMAASTSDYLWWEAIILYGQ